MKGDVIYCIYWILIHYSLSEAEAVCGIFIVLGFGVIHECDDILYALYSTDLYIFYSWMCHWPIT